MDLIAGKVDALDSQWGEFAEIMENHQEALGQLQRESSLGIGELQRQGQLLTEHHEGILQIRQESNRDDQALNNQIELLRKRVEQMAVEMNTLVPLLCIGPPMDNSEQWLGCGPN